MKIEPLKNHPELFEEVNRTCFEEFHYFFPKLSLHDFEKSLTKKLNTDKLPIFFVALEEGRLVGFFGLRRNDEEIAKEFFPALKKTYDIWLGSLVVLPKYRGQGLGKRLVEISKETAKKFGFNELYFFTDKEEFYKRLGFSTLEKTALNGTPVVIMGQDTAC